MFRQKRIGEKMVKIAVYPPNSLILADLIERKGHTPLVLQKQIRQKSKIQRLILRR